MEELETIIFFTDDGEEVEFYVLEQTKVGGFNYLLVVDTLDEEDESAEALILKEQIDEDEEMSTYVIVDDDAELDYISKIFEELSDDIELENN